MDLELTGKTAIVTGGASNIGRATALMFAEEGCNTTIWDIDAEAAGRVLARQKELGLPGDITHDSVDIREHEAVIAAVDRVKQRTGSVDILVNVAGGALRNAEFLKKDRESWQWEVDVNLWGAINTCRAAIPHMVENKYGRIVNVASEAGRVGGKNIAVYAAAKAGLIGLSKSLAREFGEQGVTVNCVCPGPTPPIDTSTTGNTWSDERLAAIRTPLEEAVSHMAIQRVGTAEEIAGLIVYVASDRCSWVTGQAWSMGGGESLY